jgi:hypothetical protein
MCFARTLSLFYDLDKFIVERLPRATYYSGCFQISSIAAKILNSLGYNVHVQLCATYHPNKDTYIPHFVVTNEDNSEVYDFKRSYFQRADGSIHKDCIKPTHMDQGFYPPHRDLCLDLDLITVREERIKLQQFKQIDHQKNPWTKVVSQIAAKFQTA